MPAVVKTIPADVALSALSWAPGMTAPTGQGLAVN